MVLRKKFDSEAKKELWSWFREGADAAAGGRFSRGEDHAEPDVCSDARLATGLRLVVPRGADGAPPVNRRKLSLTARRKRR
jgi:hypothetical protein